MLLHVVVLCILRFGMWCLSACRIMLVRMLMVVCGFVGVVVSEKAAYVFSVYLLSYN